MASSPCDTRRAGIRPLLTGIREGIPVQQQLNAIVKALNNLQVQHDLALEYLCQLPPPITPPPPPPPEPNWTDTIGFDGTLSLTTDMAWPDVVHFQRGQTQVSLLKTWMDVEFGSEPTGADLIIDIERLPFEGDPSTDWVSIYPDGNENKLIILDGLAWGEQAVFREPAPVLFDGDQLRVVVLQIGSSFAGAKCRISIEGVAS